MSESGAADALYMALSAILTLHSQDGETCSECGRGWPCRTWQLAASPGRQPAGAGVESLVHALADVLFQSGTICMSRGRQRDALRERYEAWAQVTSGVQS